MRERLARAATIGSLVAALILFVLSAFETYNSTRALTDQHGARASRRLAQRPPREALGAQGR